MICDCLNPNQVVGIMVVLVGVLIGVWLVLAAGR